MPLPDLTALLDALESSGGPARGPRLRGALAWILWENIGYLVDDARRAGIFALFEKRVGLDAGAILRAPMRTLVELAQMGGMHPDTRVERWQAIAERVETECDGDLDEALDREPKQALALLKRFPAIGTPGAEKVLLMTGRAAIFALESNGLRALTRLGFGREEKSYDKTYRLVREAVAPQIAGKPCAWLIRAHHLLRRHGQELCKRSAPRCPECPVAPSCAWYEHGRAT